MKTMTALALPLELPLALDRPGQRFVRAPQERKGRKSALLHPPEG